jgi:aerobic carbon-monoxide dehydrogenase medium subunit
MFPADFGYARADSLDRALSLLAEAAAAGTDAKLLAGGQSLLPLMKLRLATPQTLVDIGGLTELSGVASDARTTTIGALTTYRALQHDPQIAAGFPAMTDALAVLADQQVRARGTIGGCVAHGDPAADLPAVLLALDAEVLITATSDARTVPLDDFLQGIFATDLAADEIVTAITLPAVPPAAAGATGARGAEGSAYEKFEQPASHLPLAGVCAAVTIEDEVITSARVAVTGVASRPFRARHAERSLVSAPPAPSSLDAAAALVAEGVRPLSDQHASGPFRLHLAQVLAGRALRRAAGRAARAAGAAGARR